LPPHLPHDEHFLPQVPWIPWKTLKIIISMGEILTPFSIDGLMAKNAYIVTRPKVAWIDINKKSMVVQNHSVVHYIYILVAIKPCPMVRIFPWFSNFNQCFHRWTLGTLTIRTIGYPRQPFQKMMANELHFLKCG
jgi:hypothetical protein